MRIRSFVVRWWAFSFFLTSRFLRSIFLGLLLLCTATCSLTMYDLRYSNPRAEVVSICDKPLDVREGVTLWAFDSRTGRLVTGEDEPELRYFASSADFLFEYDPQAPASTVDKMPAYFGLTCKKPPSFFLSKMNFPSSLDFFQNKQPCATKTAEREIRTDPRYLAEPGKGAPPCDAPAKKSPARVRVCVHPPGMATNVNEWAMVRGAKANRFFHQKQADAYAKQAAKADVIFVFDKDAPAESVYYFGKDTKLRCPGKPAPKPYDQVAGSGQLPRLAEVTGGTSTSGEPKKGDGQTTETSSADGKGPPLSFAELLARNLAIAGALAAGDTSGSLKDPNGSRHGMVGGKNVGGFDLLPLQAAAGIFAIIQNPFKTGKDFLSAVRDAMAKGKVPAILDPKVLSKEMAEQLAKEPSEEAVKKAIEALKRGEEITLESFGKAMALSLRDAAVILPYSRAKIFTAGWEGKVQAHHLLEVEMGKILKLDAKAIDDIPAIILSEADHKMITAKLAEVRAKLLEDLAKAGEKAELKPEYVWQMYQKAYKDYPAWLAAIKGYFPNVP